MELIDTHCHLTYFERERVDAILASAKECAVTRVVCIGASEGLESAAKAVALAEQYKNVWATVGVHPHDAGSHTTLESLEKYLSCKKVVAVGETGLDYFKDWSPREMQLVLFRNSIAFAKNCKKPLVIHCRDAAADTLKVLKECKAEEVGGVFHCYAEDAEFAKRIADLNFIVSFTGNITFKKASDRRDAVAGIELERMMLETDAPYMAPEPYRGKECQPMHVRWVAEKVAEIKGVSVEEVARITTATAEKLFQL